jgi:hypothetical protein
LVCRMSGRVLLKVVLEFFRVHVVLIGKIIFIINVFLFFILTVFLFILAVTAMHAVAVNVSFMNVLLLLLMVVVSVVVGRLSCRLGHHVCVKVAVLTTAARVAVGGRDGAAVNCYD